MCYASNEKWQTTSDRMELPNQDKIRTIGEKENVRILGHLGGRHHQKRRNRRKNSERISQRTRKLLETKICSRNLTKE